jgi:hypothetical protein
MDSICLAQFTSRVRRGIPAEILRDANPNVIAGMCRAGWDNGWKDADWFLKLALQGTGHSGTRDPIATFVAQLKVAAAMECPVDPVTPTPPTFSSMIADRDRDHVPAADPGAWIAQCRGALAGKVTADA